MKTISNLTSIILHPVVICLIGVYIIVLASTGSKDEAIYWVILSGAFSVLLGLFVLLGVRQGFFNNLDVSNRKQRIILYPFAIAVVLLFTGFVYLTNGPRMLVVASIFFIVALAILDLINSRIKASIHAASVASLATGIVYLYGVSFLPMFLIVFISGYARVMAKRHTLQEVIVGALSGIVLTLVVINVVRFIMSV